MFETALALVLASEGGFSSDTRDPGGPTNLGITAATLELAKQRAVVPHGTELRDLTQEHARAIYRSLYWLPIRGDDLPPALALATFDAATNMGVPTAILQLQAALGVKTDGIIGPKTLAAARRSSADTLDSLLAARAARYADLCASRPVLLRYRHGWLRRCFRTARIAASL